MKLTIFALILLFPITAFAIEDKEVRPFYPEQSPRWVWYTEYYQEQVAAKSDEQLKKIKKSLKDLQRRLEQRQQRQQQAPIYPPKK